MFENLMDAIRLQRRKKEIFGKDAKSVYIKNGIYCDKVEKTKAYKNCIKEAEALADKMAEEESKGYRGKGFCHIFWGCKKQILEEKYNIIWRSPVELNPGCKFD